MKVFVLMTQWKDGDPEIAGVFSSFDRAVACFVREEFRDSGLPPARLATEISRMSLQMAHRTDDDDFAGFGSTRAWIEEREVDECCEEWERESEDDGR